MHAKAKKKKQGKKTVRKPWFDSQCRQAKRKQTTHLIYWYMRKKYKQPLRMKKNAIFLTEILMEYSSTIDTTISLHEWHEYFNSLSNSPLPIHTFCKGPNTATHDQEVDETQATETPNRRL